MVTIIIHDVIDVGGGQVIDGSMNSQTGGGDGGADFYDHLSLCNQFYRFFFLFY